DEENQDGRDDQARGLDPGKADAFSREDHRAHHRPDGGREEVDRDDRHEPDDLPGEPFAVAQPGDHRERGEGDDVEDHERLLRRRRSLSLAHASSAVSYPFSTTNRQFESGNATGAPSPSSIETFAARCSGYSGCR